MISCFVSSNGDDMVLLLFRPAFCPCRGRQRAQCQSLFESTPEGAGKNKAHTLVSGASTLPSCFVVAQGCLEAASATSALASTTMNLVPGMSSAVIVHVYILSLPRSTTMVGLYCNPTSRTSHMRLCGCTRQRQVETGMGCHVSLANFKLRVKKLPKLQVHTISVYNFLGFL